jgi:putative ABC transport system permease protein
MLALLRTFSWQELRHHPWRSAAAVAAVMLGVALAFAVHVINTSALDEFSQAVRAVNGQPDLELRAMQGPLPEALYAQLANHPQVARASPWLELSTLAQVDAPPTTPPTTAPAAPPAPAPARVYCGSEPHACRGAALMPRAFATKAAGHAGAGHLNARPCRP